MPVEVKVGPPVLTINQGGMFLVTDLRGEVDTDSELGLFADDTRLMSFYRLFISGQPWDLLTSSEVSYYAARIEMANPHVITESGEIAAHDVGLLITRTVADGVREDLDITSYATSPVRFVLDVAVRSDFADLFEVKAHTFVRRGGTTSVWDKRRRELVNRYAHGDFERRLTCRIAEADSSPGHANGRIVFDVAVKPNASWHACIVYAASGGGRPIVRPRRARRSAGPGARLAELQMLWEQHATRFASPNEHVTRAFAQSVEDMGALRLSERDFAPDVWFPAAGIPWFVAVFGRDSLLVSLQNMIVHPQFALGTLKKLAHYQATKIDDWRDAQPGKILHELRVGELAHFKATPHSPYYGTADATILYLIALHEAWKWLGDDALLRRYRDAAVRCLEWIDRYGDLDGDGFQEYKTRSTQGYENMGWKDSGDAVVYADGTQVKQPKALCELQGYVFDAKLRMAEVFEALGEAARAAALRRQAAALRRRFEDAFWCDDLGSYAFGLDPDKRPIRTIASNAGQLLWSGLVSPERARRVARRLLAADMWSGWGIRTLSERNPAYNPYSYQRGAVWPHDNGIIALGCKRYGFVDATNRISRALFDAAGCFKGYRLPELFAGLRRAPATFPVQYVGANIPQAWAAGSIFHVIQAILGLRADAPAGRLYVTPTLPDWLPSVKLTNLKVGKARLGLRAWREGKGCRWEIDELTGDLDVVEEAWAPWGTHALSGSRKGHAAQAGRR